MLAVVKKPHTRDVLFEITGEIPEDMLAYLEKEFGQQLEVSDEDEGFENIFATSWYQDVTARLTPGETMKIYREQYGIGLVELAEHVKIASAQVLAEIEHDQQPLTEELAAQLSQLFDVPVSRLLRQHG